MDRGRLILAAPPGSGKSTQVPQFFLNPETRLAGKILVLQPRRIAARNLALRVSQELGAPLGTVVGYQIRFESNTTPDTRIIFQTYGVFFQHLQTNPHLRGVGLVMLDEFHERTLEADGALAWMREIQSTVRPDIKLVVMSATLETESLVEYLAPAVRLEIPGRRYPVAIKHQTPLIQEPVWQQAYRAFRSLLQQGLRGTVLIFMPGVGEIRRTVETLGPLCREQGWAMDELHGSMAAAEQQRVLNVPPGHSPARVIVSTNVAETSLTIPGVTAVIDSGLARTARYDPDRDMNTLYLGRISLQNARQRTGRAGRTAPGLCLRLWSPETEKGMVDALEPEILRLELTAFVLALRRLAASNSAPSRPYLLDWLTPPNAKFWDSAERLLKDLGAIDAAGRVTDLGKSVLRFPLHPRLAVIMLDAVPRGVANVVAAMMAILENNAAPDKNEPIDLFEQGRELSIHPKAKHFDVAIRSAYQQLLNIIESRPRHPRGDVVDTDSVEELRAITSRCWMTGYKDRLAVRIGDTKSFLLADGRKGTVTGAVKDLNVIIALALHETGGAGQNRQTTIPIYLPGEARWIEALFPEECRWVRVTEWDALRKKVVAEEQLRFKELILQRRPLPAERVDREEAERLLVEKLLAGEIVPATFTEAVEQLVYRVQLVAREFPDYGLPKLDAEDWHLIYQELCRGKVSLSEVEQVSLLGAIKSYVGNMLMDFVDAAAPVARKLPSGKTAKFTYYPDGPPELTARLGDFLGLQGKTRICQGKVEVVYKILAPNYQVVQKTDDLTSFWRNTYPEVKKELQRRYPKHPWP
jgi:ATP-dependent helicase HrpB